MKRYIEDKLLVWKNKSNRKPLLINGIRQVGKTYSVKLFGQTLFDDLVYINFDLDNRFCEIFKKSKDPEKILFELSIILERKIDFQNTLIFFDEIQACNEALNSLKYFCESEEDYHVIGAGSYLGITLSKGDSFPVGKVDMLEMHPMNFKEFLLANDRSMLIDYMEGLSRLNEVSDAILYQLNDLLNEYLIVGGMPEVVETWRTSRDISKVDLIQDNIINAYFRDFSKYPPSAMVPKIVGIWQSIVPQLSRENRKFKYSEIKKSARAREYENALDWLIAGNYLCKVPAVNKLMIPLKGYESNSHFKIYMPDIGLLRKMANYPASLINSESSSENIPFKGALIENYVLQELNSIGTKPVCYHTFGNYEIDFVVQNDAEVIPIEVKAGKNVKSRSLQKILESQDIGIRFSRRNLSLDGKILNIPLALVSEWKTMLKLRS